MPNADKSELEVQWKNKPWIYLTNVTQYLKDKGLDKTNEKISRAQSGKGNRKRRQKRRQKNVYEFDHAILTDGTSLSLQLIIQGGAGKKTFSGRKVQSKPKKNTNVPDDKFTKDELNVKKTLGGDPGKGNILSLTDGYTKLTYTSNQRRKDTRLKQRQETAQKFKKYKEYGKFESEVLSKTTHRTISPQLFKEYVHTKESRQDDAKAIYSRPFFRQQKFTTYCLKKSSEDKFIKRIFDVFSKPAQITKESKAQCLDPIMRANCQKTARDKSDIVIGYGGWGQSCNLKGSASSPGIGFRRIINRHYKTKTINEHYTSQVCASCGYKAEKQEKHHLLRCKNENCRCRFWNRDMLGSLNILKRTINGGIITRPIS